MWVFGVVTSVVRLLPEEHGYQGMCVLMYENCIISGHFKLINTSVCKSSFEL